MKTIQEVVESSASVSVDPDRVQIVMPEDFAMPPGGLHIRWPDAPLEQEARLMDHKWYAALAYVRANRLNHNVVEARTTASASSPAARFNDTRQALATWASTTRPAGRSASACTRSAWSGRSRRRSRATSRRASGDPVVEEKRQVIEYQLKEAALQLAARRRA